MEELKSYLALAWASTVAEFVTQSNLLFLVKRPRKQASVLRAPVPISYETQLTKLEVDPYAAEWRIAEVKKRAGNPYPDRFSIGRAPNCDVVIRLPSISKVHAHIVISGPGAYSLRDNEASNATFVNGRKLDSKGSAKIRIGDELAFGSLVVEFVDAERFYQILRSEAVTSKFPSISPGHGR
jgi:hypothetical protein